MSYYKEILWFFSRSSFIELVREEGIVICLLIYLILILLLLLFSPFLILAFPFVYINTKSMNWFNGDENGK